MTQVLLFDQQLSLMSEKPAFPQTMWSPWACCNLSCLQMGQDAVLNAMMTVEFFFRAIILYVYWVLNSRKSIILLWNFYTFLITVPMIIFPPKAQYGVTIYIFQWKSEAIIGLSTAYNRNLFLPSWFSFLMTWTVAGNGNSFFPIFLVSTTWRYSIGDVKLMNNSINEWTKTQFILNVYLSP